MTNDESLINQPINLESSDSKDQEYYNKNINVSYLDPDLPVPSVKLICTHYFCSIIVYGIAFFIIVFNTWYDGLLKASLLGLTIKEFFYLLYWAYIVLALPIFLIVKPKSIWNSSNTLICNYFMRLLKSVFKAKNQDKPVFKPNYREQQAMLLFLVKFYFGPQMVQYASSNFAIIVPQLSQLLSKLSIISGNSLDLTHAQILNIKKEYFHNLYPFLITLLFFIDTSFFAVGYFTEAGFLGNKVRQVENTIFGIFVCLICYPPFNTVTCSLIGWYQNDTSTFFDNENSIITWVFRLAAILFLIIYTSASIALFTKASNLTNRGTVTIWPYSMVRHPAYISKNMFWWLTTIPILFTNTPISKIGWGNYIITAVIIILSMGLWNLIYYLRAITEEKLMMKDPEYRAYAQRVKYRFIPGIW